MQTKLTATNLRIHALPLLLSLIFMVMAWLNPIHKQPWLSFWSDTFAAFAFLLIFQKIAFQFRNTIELPKPGIIFLLVSLLPWGQYAFGQVAYFGVAWVNFVYLLGFSLAFLIGWNWEKNDPRHGLDFIFTAILLASVCSVGMQLGQCVFPDLDWWWLPSGLGSRFAGSLGHPNLLGTLHVWGLLSVLWIGNRWSIDWRVGFAVAFWLLIGIALVESRTAWLNVAIGFAVIFLFWKKNRPRFLGGTLGLFTAFLIAMYFAVPQINVLFREHSLVIYRDAHDSVRLDLLSVFFQAFLERPWFGYGFGGGREAYISGDIPGFSAWASHTHNLLLDVAIYLGAPGLIIFLSALFFLLRCFSSCLKDGDLRFIVPALAILVVLIHAMLEYPLHYAFFLLPTGLVLGHFLRMVDVGHGVPVRVPVLYGMLVLVGAAVFMTVVEGVKVERMFNEGEDQKGQGFVRQFMLLDQWDDRLRLAYIPKNIALTPEISEKIRNVLVAAPGADLIEKYVEILNANGATVDAQRWLNILCKTSSLPYRNDIQLRQITLAHEQNPFKGLDLSACND